MKFWVLRPSTKFWRELIKDANHLELCSSTAIVSVSSNVISERCKNDVTLSKRMIIYCFLCMDLGERNDIEQFTDKDFDPHLKIETS